MRLPDSGVFVSGASCAQVVLCLVALILVGVLVGRR